jgi:hypothetical protein
MSEFPTIGEMELTLAALKLRKNYQATRTLMFSGELRGRRIGRRWYVDRGDVERLAGACSDVDVLAQPA